MKVNSDIGIFQCYLCDFRENDISYFHILSSEEELICIGCYENYQADCDVLIYKEDGE